MGLLNHKRHNVQFEPEAGTQRWAERLHRVGKSSTNDFGKRSMFISPDGFHDVVCQEVMIVCRALFSCRNCFNGKINQIRSIANGKSDKVRLKSRRYGRDANEDRLRNRH